MPTYAYQCQKCKNSVEMTHKMIEKPQYICQKCKKNIMHIVPTGGIGVHFKGTGFYETDYKNKEKN